MIKEDKYMNNLKKIINNILSHDMIKFNNGMIIYN
jgi:hypothetical protein